jgi:hypothetical protein
VSQQINLFNPIFLKQKKYFSALTMLQALGLILLGSALLAVYVNLQLSHLKQEAAITSANLKASEARLAVVNQTYGAREKNKALDDEVRHAEAEVLALQQVTATLQRGDFGNTDGYSEYFKAFARQSVSGLWLTGLSLSGAGSEIDIRGRALQPDLVPTYISRLRQESVMRGKSFGTLDIRLPPARESKADGAGGRAPADFIEFHLQSSEAGSEQSAEARIR